MKKINLKIFTTLILQIINYLESYSLNFFLANVRWVAKEYEDLAEVGRC